MKKATSRLKLVVPLAAAILLVVVSGAFALADGAYRGKSGQKGCVRGHARSACAVSLNLASGKVRNLHFFIRERCPDTARTGHTLTEDVAGFGVLPVSAAGRFGGRFTTLHGHKGEGSTVDGRIGARNITIFVTDSGWSRQERRLCHGKATFKLHHV